MTVKHSAKFLLILIGLYSTSVYGDWSGSLALRNNYVFSTGTQIDDNPVFQIWLNKKLGKGFYAGLWSNIPLAAGNPNRSGEIDWTVGYNKNYKSNNFDISLSYFDIQFPGFFDNSSDFISPLVRWSNDHFFAEATYFYSDVSRDGYRGTLGFNFTFAKKWTITSKFNYADGPFSSQKIGIGKINLSYDFSTRFIDIVSAEANLVLFTENPNETKEPAITFSFIKYLF